MNEERFVDMETRLAFLEDAQQQLSDVIARQEKEIEALNRRVVALGEQLREVAPNLIADAADEPPPPHY